MSGFVTFEAEVVVKTPLSFFRGELFNSDGIYIHGIGISFLLGVVIVVSIVEEREERVVSSFFNFVGPFLNMFEVKSLLVPFLHGSQDGVHGVDSSHELGGDSSGKEVDQDILISDSTRGGVVLEFGNVVKDIYFVINFCGGQPCYGLLSCVFEDEWVIEFFEEVSPGSKAQRVVGEGCFGFSEGPEPGWSFFHKRKGECNLLVIVVIDILVHKEVELGIIDPGSCFLWVSIESWRLS